MSGRETPPVDFDADGLVPAVIRDEGSGEVLMLGFMNEAALAKTRETGTVHFWSRSRGRLWQKGETSGHVQHVQAIYVNCEQNSLLVDVQQVGAVCHEGFPTCFYRRLESDNALTTIRDRWFDPADIYGDAPQDGLGTLTKRQMDAYVFLRNHDLSAASATSRLLRQPHDDVTPRLADELDELAGALAGTHRHVDRRADVALEAGQVLYWLLLRCLRDGVPWERLRPDRALDVGAVADSPADPALGRLLAAASARWRGLNNGRPNVAAEAHATLHLVAQSCVAAGVAPREIIERDLVELRSRPYLQPFFESFDRA